MILCPNCNQPFEEKAGKLFCAEHGWHKQNEAGEIVPAEEPTAEEIAAAEKQEASAEPAKQQIPGTGEQPSAVAPSPDTPPEPVQAVRTDQQAPPAICLGHGDKMYYVFLAVAGLAAAGILAYTYYKNKQHKKAAGV